MKKRIAAALIALGLIAGLSSCSGGSTQQGDSAARGNTTFDVEQVALPDGGSVTCVYYVGYRTGAAVSCNWDAVNTDSDQ